MRTSLPFIADKTSLPLSTYEGMWTRKEVSTLVSKFFMKHYDLIAVILSVIVVALMTVEHQRWLKNNHSPVYSGEMLVIVLLLVLTAFITKKLLNAVAEKSQIIRTLQVKHDFSMSLVGSQNLPDLTSHLIQKVTSLLPLAEAQLYLYDGQKSWFTAVNQPAAQAISRAAKQNDITGIDPSLCQKCLFNSSSTLHSLHTCQQTGCRPHDRSGRGYCLALVEKDHPVGLLHLYAKPQQQLTQEETELLKDVAVEVTNSLQLALMKQAHEKDLVAQEVHQVQLGIARDLHDTIGQNISYLRMKLDQLADTAPQTQSRMTDEIQQMSAVANESYDLVRGTLSVLQSGGAADLRHIFTRYANQVAERASFNIEFHREGSERSLSPHQMRQLFYIFREAISNIEKHARASQVWVEMIWEADHLCLILSDNGRGFDPNQSLLGHYGLKFMQERTEQIGGSFSVLSTIDSGSSIVIQMQYQA